MPEEKCETCRFFHDERPWEMGRGSRADLYGYCRCHPPTVIQRIAVASQPSIPQTGWPVVAKGDWCGDYERVPREPSLTEI